MNFCHDILTRWCSAAKWQWGSQDDLTCAEFIWGKLSACTNCPESDGEVVRPKEPNWTAWANEVRLMVMQDGRTHKQICSLFKRANKDSFWCKNMLSPSKLREKWDELSLKLAAAHSIVPARRRSFRSYSMTLIIQCQRGSAHEQAISEMGWWKVYPAG
jgi:hypothetical protein